MLCIRGHFINTWLLSLFAHLVQNKAAPCIIIQTPLVYKIFFKRNNNTIIIDYTFIEAASFPLKGPIMIA